MHPSLATFTSGRLSRYSSAPNTSTFSITLTLATRLPRSGDRSVRLPAQRRKMALLQTIHVSLSSHSNYFSRLPPEEDLQKRDCTKAKRSKCDPHLEIYREF